MHCFAAPTSALFVRKCANTPPVLPLPQEAGAANAVFLHDPSRENKIAERPQTLRYLEIKNKFSAENG